VTSIRTRRMRGAPRERRTAISRRREAARESNSVATLAQAMKSTRWNAPNRKVIRNRSRAEPTISKVSIQEPSVVSTTRAAAGIERVQLALQTGELGLRHGARVSMRETAGKLKP